MKKGNLYVISDGTGGFKIGNSKQPSVRCRALAKSLRKPCELVLVVEHEDSEGLEDFVHEAFAEKRYKGEWFRLEEGDVDRITALASAYVADPNRRRRGSNRFGSSDGRSQVRLREAEQRIVEELLESMREDGMVLPRLDSWQRKFSAALAFAVHISRSRAHGHPAPPP